MRHNLNIRVSDKPRNGGVVACRTVSIREKLFTLLLGPKQKVMVVVISPENILTLYRFTMRSITSITAATLKRLK